MLSILILAVLGLQQWKPLNNFAYSSLATSKHYLVVTADFGAVTVLDRHSLKVINTISIPGGAEYAIFGRNEHELVIGGDKRLVRLDPLGKVSDARWCSVPRISARAAALAVSGSMILYGFEDGHLVTWDMATDRSRTVRVPGRIWSLTPVPGTRLVAYGSLYRARVLRLGDWKVLKVQSFPINRVGYLFDVAAIDSRKVALSFQNGDVCMWDVTSMQAPKLSFHVDGMAFRIAPYDSGRGLAVITSDSLVRKFRGKALVVLHSLVGGKSAEFGTDGHADDLCATLPEKEVFVLWQTGRFRSFEGH